MFLDALGKSAANKVWLFSQSLLRLKLCQKPSITIINTNNGIAIFAIFKKKPPLRIARLHHQVIIKQKPNEAWNTSRSPIVAPMSIKTLAMGNIKAQKISKGNANGCRFKNNTIVVINNEL